MTGQRRADDYDVLVDWDARLAREAPFFRTLFERHAVGSVADVGAGSGRHAIAFRSWGLDVWAVDPSEEMLARARENIANAGVTIRLAKGAFGEVADLLPKPVDAVTCLGNALPHVDGIDGLRRALADFYAALRPGGVVVLHLLNHHRIVAHGVRTIPAVFRETEEGDAFYLRVMDADEAGERLYLDFVTLVRDAAVRGSQRPADWERTPTEDPAGGWRLSCRRSVHTAIPYGTLVAELRAAGFGRVELFGGHDFRPFSPSEDESVIAVALKE
ncbi:MAG: class I SAM-dependent methyltransferase [Coriobacteriia bacterium]|nr:class I SAM-dependent methyltransferase [Coriobacteriia bacterium]